MDTELNEITYARGHYTCVYCGFDGRDFDSWLQLTIEHVMPRSCGGKDEPSNRVVACRWCNSTTGKMRFSSELTREEILASKRDYIAKSRRHAHELWMREVAPKHLDRPLSPLDPFSDR